MPYRPPPELSSLDISEIAELALAQKLPPVEEWQPDVIGDSEIQVTADGRWFHQGGEITRPAMVRAFSTLLRREVDGSFALVTPFQKLSIEIADTAFLAVEVESEDQGGNRRLAFRLNTDHLVLAGPDHPLKFLEEAEQVRPLLHVRNGLMARLARPVYYQLVEWALAEDGAPPGLWSDGAFFAMDAPA